MPALAIEHKQIVEAERRLRAAHQILERAAAGLWTIESGTVEGVEKLCASAISHLRGVA